MFYTFLNGFFQKNIVETFDIRHSEKGFIEAVLLCYVMLKNLMFRRLTSKEHVCPWGTLCPYL